MAGSTNRAQHTYWGFQHPARKMAPVEGAIHRAASLRSMAVVVVEVLMMVMRQMIRLCTWNRANGERNSSDRS